MSVRRIGLIGFGAIARTAIDAVRQHCGAVQVSALLVREGKAVARDVPEGCRIVHDVGELIDLSPDGVFECAGHEAVRQYAAPILAAGRNFHAVSVGALADDDLLQELQQAALNGTAKLVILAGALAGIEALAAARFGGLDHVVHTVVKPPSAWKGTLADQLVKLDQLREPSVFFEGSAMEAARGYPKNANSTAAVALAGAGLRRTKTILVADPHATGNLHRLEATGAFGEMSIELRGRPLAASPMSSTLAALSVARAIVGTVPGIHI